jgi:predicted regulator of Ras-like GTPase activity (Roadblock/LC7/MglB family)
MFKDALRDVVEGTEGGIAGLLMGFDGIAVESYTKSDGGADITTVGMELSVVLKDIRRAVEQLQAGVAREIAIQAEKVTTLVRLLNNDYFIALTMTPDGNFGKGRFLLRLAAPKLLSNLE